MKKIKIVFAVLAAAAGTSGAIASNLPSSSSAPEAIYDWLNWDDEVVLIERTPEQAQLACSGTMGICLRAKDNTWIHTYGEYLFSKKK